MFGFQLPLTRKVWVTLCTLTNKVRGKYFYKEVFLRLYHCVGMYPVYIYVYFGMNQQMTIQQKFNHFESRSFVMKKRRTADKFRFSIAGTMIPTLSECPVKSLGKIFNIILRDTNDVRAAVGDLELWLARVDKSGLPSRFKAWLYQHVVLPRILWLLFVYDSPMTVVETMERKINTYLRRWLGVPRSLSSAVLYGTSNALQLPFKGLVEEL